MGGCIATALGVLLLGPMMGSGSLFLIFLFLALALTLMGFVYGPLGTWLPGLFPPQVRYTGASMAFNLGGILRGALAPIVAQALADRSEEHTSELQSLMRTSYAVFCLKHNKSTHSSCIYTTLY